MNKYAVYQIDLVTGERSLLSRVQMTNRQVFNHLYSLQEGHCQSEQPRVNQSNSGHWIATSDSDYGHAACPLT